MQVLADLKRVPVCDQASANYRIGGQAPRYGSAEDIAPRTVGRGPVPRHAPVLTANVRGFWTADVSRFGRQIAGGQAPALRHLKHPSYHRRARA